MVKRVISLLILICAFGLAAPAAAQDTASGQSGCDIAALNQLMDTFLTSLQAVKDKKSTDPVQLSDYLQKLANVANQTRAFCDGLTFSGKKQIVIGPVTIPAGIYRAVATTSGPLIVNLTITDGECESRTTGEEKGVFALQKGEADDGAEAVFTSKGCTVLIEVSLVRADWKLSFERVTTS